MQATDSAYDEKTRGGAVLLDDGTELEFGPAALAGTGLRLLRRGQRVRIETALSPPWTTDWISDSGKAKLHAYGIAPPSEARTATCPQCGSTQTEEISRFGSTPCKAQWRCRDCLEPFDRFKCH